MKLVEVASIYGKDPVEIEKAKKRGYIKLKRKGVIVMLKSGGFFGQSPVANTLVLGLVLPLTLTIEDYAADDWETVTDD